MGKNYDRKQRAVRIFKGIQRGLHYLKAGAFYGHLIVLFLRRNTQIGDKN